LKEDPIAENESMRVTDIFISDKGKEIKKGRRVVRKGLFDWPSENPSLIGARCKSYSDVFFPRRFICPVCFQRALN
jgi:uncharacterized OB-fold protein